MTSVLGIGGAIISQCGRYRYSLTRTWAQSDRMPILWVMLNPSTADADTDDRTIAKITTFSKSWGYGSLMVGNVYAYRSTDPSALYGLPEAEAFGPENNAWLYQMSRRAALTVCAWGNHARPGHLSVADITSPGGLWCLAINKNGSPKHPLYIRGDSPLREYRP